MYLLILWYLPCIQKTIKIIHFIKFHFQTSFKDSYLGGKLQKEDSVFITKITKATTTGGNMTEQCKWVGKQEDLGDSAPVYMLKSQISPNILQLQ